MGWHLCMGDSSSNVSDTLGIVDSPGPTSTWPSLVLVSLCNLVLKVAINTIMIPSTMQGIVCITLVLLLACLVACVCLLPMAGVCVFAW